MEVIRSMPKYKELFSLYQNHLKMCENIFKGFDRLEWKKLIDLEQLIISGVEKNGRPVLDRDIIKGLTSISKNLSREDHTRLLIQYLSCYELNKKDRYNIITSIQNDAFE